MYTYTICISHSISDYYNSYDRIQFPLNFLTFINFLKTLGLIRENKKMEKYEPR